jgi:hypothetical protein
MAARTETANQKFLDLFFFDHITALDLRKEPFARAYVSTN